MSSKTKTFHIFEKNISCCSKCGGGLPVPRRLQLCIVDAAFSLLVDFCIRSFLFPFTFTHFTPILSRIEIDLQFSISKCNSLIVVVMVCQCLGLLIKSSGISEKVGKISNHFR